jgi:hypothetical protein
VFHQPYNAVNVLDVLNQDGPAQQQQHNTKNTYTSARQYLHVA